MSRKCTICYHDRRAEIEASIVNGDSYRDIQGRFEVAKSTVGRHQSDHMSGTVALAVEEREVSHGERLVEAIEELVADAHGIKAAALKSQDLRIALSAIDRLEGLIRTKAEFLLKAEELRQRSGAHDVNSDPGWLALRARIIVALDPFPEAKRAVVAACAVGDT